MSDEYEEAIHHIKKLKNKFSLEMQYIIQEKAKEIEIPGAGDMDHDALTCAIIKDKKTDRRLQALIIARRFLYCCSSSSPPAAVNSKDNLDDC